MAGLISWQLIGVVLTIDLFYKLTLGIGLGLIWQDDEKLSSNTFKDYSVLGSILTITLAAVIEEFAFRFFPVVIARIWSGTHSFTIYTVIVVTISTFFFGLLHGSWKNIFLQGFSSLCYFFIFLNTGGLEPGIIPLLIATANAIITHILYNYILLGLIGTILLTLKHFPSSNLS